MEKIHELFSEIEEARNYKESQYLNNLIEALFESSTKEEILRMQKKYHCDIYMSKEKHNALQYTYYFEITSELIKGELYLEIESGISNGTLLVNYSFITDLKPTSRTVDVLKGVVFSEKGFENWISVYKNMTDVRKNQLRQIAESLFTNNKDKILRLYKNQNYDNYVTGGGTNKTDKYYDDEIQLLKDRGCFWECVYEEIETDINFV